MSRRHAVPIFFALGAAGLLLGWGIRAGDELGFLGEFAGEVYYPKIAADGVPDAGPMHASLEVQVFALEAPPERVDAAILRHLTEDRGWKVRRQRRSNEALVLVNDSSGTSLYLAKSGLFAPGEHAPGPEVQCHVTVLRPAGGWLKRLLRR